MEYIQVLRTSYPKTSIILALIGLIIVYRKVIRVLNSFYRCGIRPRKNLKKRYGEKTWAFITGSSEGINIDIIGIGRAFAFSLAK